MGAIEATLPAVNPHLVYTELKSRGFAVVAASQDELRVDYLSPKDNSSGTSPVSTLASFRVAPGATQVERV